MSKKVTRLDLEKSNENNVNENVDTHTNANENEDPFLQNCNELLSLLNKNYREEREKIKNLIKTHQSDLKNAKKNNRKKRENMQTGFTKPEKVPNKLAKFVNMPTGTLMSRTELTKKVYNIIKERGLFYKEDKRVLRADNEIMRIFNLNKEVNNSTDPKDKNGLNFYNLQKYIAQCYTEIEPEVNQKKENVKVI